MDHRLELLAIVEESAAPYLQQATDRVRGQLRFQMTSNAEEGLHVLRRALPSKLIIVDDSARELSGFTLLRQIRQMEGSIYTPVVLLVNTGDSAALSDAYGAGANSVIVKPDFERDMLLLFTNLLIFWCTINRVARWPEEREERR